VFKVQTISVETSLYITKYITIVLLKFFKFKFDLRGLNHVIEIKRYIKVTTRLSNKSVVITIKKDKNTGIY
jgi:hypothetical protein